MSDPEDSQRRIALQELLQQRRRELGAQAGVSQRLRELSQSGSRYPVPQQPLHRSRLVAILIGGGAGLALLLCIVIVAAVIAGGLLFQSQLSDPSTTVEDYYSALQTQDYARAYSYLSSSAQRQMNEATFASDSRAEDDLAGVIVSYSIVSDTSSGSTAAIVVDVVRRGLPTQAHVEAISLVKSNNTWQINSFRDTGVAPAPTPVSG
ncbi:MAG TPA: hypothetical protein VKQ36_07300 [Ktedonobacterales bacterium]|nr:hypothetical protein [Ktedonobacterales bacterium]